MMTEMNTAAALYYSHLQVLHVFHGVHKRALYQHMSAYTAPLHWHTPGDTVKYMQVFIIPEVYQLICDEVAAGMGVTPAVRASQLAVMPPHSRHQQLLYDVCAWLTINSMKSEKVQWNLLMEQQVSVLE